MMDIIAHAREVFANDRYATDTTGIMIEDCSVNHSLVSLKLDGRHRNAVGEVMGAVYYTLADFAFAVASNYDRPMTVTLQSSISYMSSCRGDTLFAEADCTKEGGRTCFYDITITDNMGNYVAKAQTTGYKMAPHFPAGSQDADGDPYREQIYLFEQAKKRASEKQ